LKSLTNFVDDNFVIRWNINFQTLIGELESDLGLIIVLLRDSGLNLQRVSSILFNNSEIWHIPSLNPYLKNQIKSASANDLKICIPLIPQIHVF
jgi:hypothetical protein